jgi:hypothetical protein
MFGGFSFKELHARWTLMRKILFTVVAVVAVASLSGCAGWDIGKGKGKGKAPPPVYEEPAPAPVYK